MTNSLASSNAICLFYLHIVFVYLVLFMMNKVIHTNKTNEGVGAFHLLSMKLSCGLISRDQKKCEAL